MLNGPIVYSYHCKYRLIYVGSNWPTKVDELSDVGQRLTALWMEFQSKCRCKFPVLLDRTGFGRLTTPFPRLPVDDDGGLVTMKPHSNSALGVDSKPIYSQDMLDEDLIKALRLEARYHTNCSACVISPTC